MNQNLTKAVSRKLKYYMEVKRLEDGFDLSYNNNDNNIYNNDNSKGGRAAYYHAEPMIMRGTPANIEKEEEVREIANANTKQFILCDGWNNSASTIKKKL